MSRPLPTTGPKRLSRRFRQLPLKQQLSWAMLTVGALSLLIAGFALLGMMAHSTRQALNEELRSVADLVANRSSAAVAFGDESTARENLAALNYLTYVGQACLLDANGVLLSSFTREGLGAECPTRAALQSAPAPGATDPVSLMAPVLAGDQMVGVLWVRATPGVIVQRLVPVLWASGFAVVLAIAAGWLVAAPLMRAISAPVSAIRDVTQRVIDSGDNTLRAPELGPNELGQLAAAFNRMLQTIGDQNRSLADSEHYARTLFAGSHQAQLVIERANGRVRDANAASARLLGYSGPQALIGLGFSDLLPPAQTWDDGFWERLHPETTEALELPMRRAGLDHPWDCHAHFLRLTVSGHALVHCSLEDVTQRKADQQALLQSNEVLEQRVSERTDDLAHTIERLNQAREQLVEIEKQSALGRLVAGMAHEINTPVGNAKLALSTVQAAHDIFNERMAQGIRRSDLTQLLAQLQEGTHLAQRNLERVVELVSTFKQISADQASSLSRDFELASLVADVLKVMGPQLRRTPYTLVTSIAPDLLMRSHAGPLEQVLVNLINNAILHGFDGRDSGTITVSAQASRGHRVRLSVSDDGCGIHPEHLSRIFDPFFTTKMGRGGIGLGLAIVHNLVTQLLGGTLSVHSRPGEGTRFELDLPEQAPTQALHSRPAPLDA